MPSGKVANPSIEQNPDGTVSIKYQPSEVGLHELDVFYNGQPIQGSPFKFHVDAINSLTGNNRQGGYVTAYGPGLSHGNCNEPCEFRIVTKNAGTGGLAVAVEGPSKAEIQCRDNKNGTCDVVYYPTAPGDYTITVKFADKHIVGSPFTAKIAGDTRYSKRNQLILGNQSDISLKVVEGDVNDLQATIKSPSGHEEPCLLKKLSNGSLGISFTPREVGEHIVSVLREGKHIKNSPFRIEVRQSEIGDASKVKVYGKGLTEGTANKVNEFFVNTKDAGKLEFERKILKKIK
jgi:filamin